MKLQHKKKRLSKFSATLIGAILTIFVFAPLSVISAPLSVPPITSVDGKHELSDIIADNDWAIVLGRAFFWDQQMGSDGGSCASCHYAAGADIRITAQVNPGFTTVDPAIGTDTFGCTEGSECIVGSETSPSGAKMTPEYTLTPEDFPFRKLVDNDPSQVLTATNDVVSSSGSFDAKFKGSYPGSEHCGKASADIFYKTEKHGHGQYKLAARMVEPRNTPTTINAALNYRNFWDGRAENIFSGVGVHGMADVVSEGTENNRLIVMNGNYPELTHLSLRNSSAASQAVGPILSNLEMSCDGRTFQDVARKIYSMRPLAKQRIAYDDSTFAIGVKGDLRAKKRGLKNKYRYYKLIQLAFDEKWWKANGAWKIEGGELKKARSSRHGFTQMEMNFPMFWGLAIQAYEQTLISDQSKFDTAEALGCFGFLADDTNRPAECTQDVWSDSEELGRLVFNTPVFLPPPARPRDATGRPVNHSNCAVCHAGNATTDVAVINPDGSFIPVIDLGATTDAGFHGTGTRSVLQDLQLGGTDGYGNPLGLGRQLANFVKDGTPPVNPDVDICDVTSPLAGGATLYCTDGVRNDVPFNPVQAIDSVSKTSTIRNIALTPPYFAYGGYSNLEQVMDFYMRGGSQEVLAGGGNTTGSGPNGDWTVEQIIANKDLEVNHGSNLGLMIPLQLTPEERTGVIDFMKSFTDERVRCDAAPFDHPELIIFNGHKGKDKYGFRVAADKKVRLPAVGAYGYSDASGLCLPNDGDLFAPDMGNRLGENR